jgi:hypothetical protein
MVEGHSKEVVDQVKSLVEEEVSCTMGVPHQPLHWLQVKPFSPSTC